MRLEKQWKGFVCCTIPTVHRAERFSSLKQKWSEKLEHAVMS
jgi:hypothetical protein